MELLKIGQVARRACVGVETVRFYERQGLIEDPARSESGYRLYEKVAIDRLRFIRRAKELGFSLREIGELLSLRLDQSKKCGHVKKQAEGKLAEIEMKIKSLQRVKRALLKLTLACDGTGATSECPILDALERDESDRYGRKKQRSRK